jgi:hypothetical protein
VKALRVGDRERDLRARVVKRLRALGCEVMSTSSPKPSRIAKGMPDLYVIPPRGKPPFWIEMKAPGGKASPEQVAFAAKHEPSGMAVIIGGEAEVLAHITTLGLVAPRTA